MNCDIVIRSYRRDFEWLRYSLQSIDRFCRGFRRVLVVIPESSRAWLVRSGIDVRNLFAERDVRDDYHGQQVTKLYADTLTDADLICHVDSDCIFEGDFTPADLLIEGRPRMVMASYASLSKSNPWRTITSRFLGAPVRFEFMRLQPQVFPRWIYAELRAFTRERHGVELDEYVLAQPPRGFSEYNALGAYAWRFHRDRFTFVDVSKSDASLPRCRWYWSWGGLTPEIREEIESLLDAPRHAGPLVTAAKSRGAPSNGER